MKGSLFATSLLAVATTVAAAAPARAAEPKYYFQIKEVTAAPDVDAAVKTDGRRRAEGRARLAARMGLRHRARPRRRDRSALAAELTKRKLRGFDVTVRIETFKKEMKDPRPGGRLKQLAVNVQLSVIGATIPDAKFAFEGNGEAGVEAEVSEKRMADGQRQRPRRPPSRARSSRRSSRPSSKLGAPTPGGGGQETGQEEELRPREPAVPGRFPGAAGFASVGAPPCSRSKLHCSAPSSRWPPA